MLPRNQRRRQTSEMGSFHKPPRGKAGPTFSSRVIDRIESRGSLSQQSRSYRAIRFNVNQKASLRQDYESDDSESCEMRENYDELNLVLYDDSEMVYDKSKTPQSP